jgi:hypothetical protein
MVLFVSLSPYLRRASCSVIINTNILISHIVTAATGITDSYTFAPVTTGEEMALSVPGQDYIPPTQIVICFSFIVCINPTLVPDLDLFK